MERARIFPVVIMIAVLAVGLASSGMAMSGREMELRQKLGVPDEARQVIVFAQSSHVDPDWMATADQYQRLATDRAFKNALEELEKDPSYVYSVECIFFFKRFWDSHPERREALRAYANQGRIRFTGTGVTTPDTLLPEPENLIRDYLVGRKWLRQVGINADPRLAYLPDCFGHSPSWPSILREMGYKYTAFARVDGGYSVGSDTRDRSEFPFTGSSAETLEREKTLDFIWEAPDGSRVLAHWARNFYSQGDNIARTPPGILLSVPLGLPATLPRQTNANIDGYINALAPYSKTGYMFCPVGGDFMSPVPNLGEFMRTYNRTRYPATGVYAVLAGLEDYMELVECHQDQLPVLSPDPNPLWMGFYSSRPALKLASRRLSQSLVLAEWIGAIAEIEGSGPYPDLAPPWYASLFSNHHDFITGTSFQHVYENEQMPVLIDAQAEVDRELERLMPLFAPRPDPTPPPVQWSQSGGMVTVENEFYKIEIDAERGGCITSWFDKARGRETLAGPSNDIVIYEDRGDLWRMGHEFSGGMFRELDRSSMHPARLHAELEDNVLAVIAALKMEKREVVRTLYFRSDSPAVRMEVEGSVRENRTATIAFMPALTPGRFVQEVPYGVVERPIVKNYDPTFWAAKNWVDLTDASERFGINLALSAPAAVCARPAGRIELVAFRKTPWKRVFGVLTPSLPKAETDFCPPVRYGAWPHGPEGWLERRVFQTASTLLDDSWIDPRIPDWQGFVASLVNTDSSRVVVTAMKKAEDGEGWVVRLFKYGEGPVLVRLRLPESPQKAWLCDGLERPLAPLPVKGGRVELTMPYALAGVLVKY